MVAGVFAARSTHPAPHSALIILMIVLAATGCLALLAYFMYDFNAASANVWQHIANRPCTPTRQLVCKISQ